MTSKKMGLTIALLLLVILIVIPLLLIGLTSIFQNNELDFLAPIKTIVEKDLSEVYINSIILGLSVVIGSTLFAAPIAFLMAKTEFQKYRWIDIVLLIPFMTPPYIGSMGWIMFMQPKGFLEQLIPALGFLSSIFFHFFGLVLVMSLHLFPFMYLIIRNALIQISGGLEEAATVHGATFNYRFRRIVIPLLLSSYAMGALLIFVKTIAEFGTPATLGRTIGYYVLTTKIHHFISSWPIDFGKATSLSMMLLSTSLFIWYIQSVVSNRFTYRLVGGKGTRRSIYTFRIGGKLLGWFYIGGLLSLSIGVPYFSIIATSTMKLRGYGLSWGNFTLDHYRELFTLHSPGLNALLTSLELSLISATIAVILGTFLALMVSINKGWSQRITDSFSLLPNTVPSIVMVVGLILFWNAPWMPLRIYNTRGIVILTYVILFLPYTVQYVKANFSQIDPTLFHAGRVFGGNYFYIFRRIILPLIIPGLIAGWMMTFIISIRELVASLMILPPSMKTSATFIFAQFEQGSVSLGMAMAVVSVGLTTLVLIAINRFIPTKE